MSCWPKPGAAVAAEFLARFGRARLWFSDIPPTAKIHKNPTHVPTARSPTLFAGNFDGGLPRQDLHINLYQSNLKSQQMLWAYYFWFSNRTCFLCWSHDLRKILLVNIQTRKFQGRLIHFSCRFIFSNRVRFSHRPVLLQCLPLTHEGSWTETFEDSNRCVGLLLPGKTTF